MSLPIALKPGVHYRLTKDIENPDRDGRSKRDPTKQAVIPTGVEFMARGSSDEIFGLQIVSWPNYSESRIVLRSYNDEIRKGTRLYEAIVDSLEMLPQTPNRFLRALLEETSVRNRDIVVRLMEKGMVTEDSVKAVAEEIYKEYENQD